MKKIVITGDIINSRAIKDKALLIEVLENIFKDITSKIHFITPFEIYRGYGFQALINTNQALRIALLIRLGLRKKAPKKEIWDARIGIGIGTVDYQKKDIKISNGEAFELSGMALDSIKKAHGRIRIKTTNTAINNDFDTLNALADALSKRWTKNASEVIYRYLLWGETQKEIAEKLKISQSAVQQRFANADFEAINTYIRYFESLKLN